MKKSISIILVTVMVAMLVLSVVPFSAFAAGESGECSVISDGIEFENITFTDALMLAKTAEKSVYIKLHTDVDMYAGIEFQNKADIVFDGRQPDGSNADINIQVGSGNVFRFDANATISFINVDIKGKAASNQSLFQMRAEDISSTEGSDVETINFIDSSIVGDFKQILFNIQGTDGKTTKVVNIKGSFIDAPEAFVILTGNDAADGKMGASWYHYMHCEIVVDNSVISAATPLRQTRGSTANILINDSHITAKKSGEAPIQLFGPENLREGVTGMPTEISLKLTNSELVPFKNSDPKISYNPENDRIKVTEGTTKAWTVSSVDGSAQDGVTGDYDTLAEAVTAVNTLAQKAVLIKLNKSVTESTAVQFDTGVSVTVDGEGRTLKTSTYNFITTKGDNGKAIDLKIKNLKIEDSGEGNIIVINNAGKADIENVTVNSTGNIKWSLINVNCAHEEGADVTLTKVVLKSKTEATSAAGEATALLRGGNAGTFSKITLNECYIDATEGDGTTPRNGIAVTSTNAELIINGTTVLADQGYAILCSAVAKSIVATDSVFTSAKYADSAISNMTNVTITDNEEPEVTTTEKNETTTKEPTEETTPGANETTTEKPDGETTPDNGNGDVTTVPTVDDATGGCGGCSGTSVTVQLIALFCAAGAAFMIWKK